MKKEKIIEGAITLSSLALLVACAPQDSGTKNPVIQMQQSSIQFLKVASFKAMNEWNSMKRNWNRRL